MNPDFSEKDWQKEQVSLAQQDLIREREERLKDYEPFDEEIAEIEKIFDPTFPKASKSIP